MEKDTENQVISGISKKVFESFLSALEKADFPREKTDALRNTLINDADISEEAIRRALFPDTNTL